MKKIVSLLYTIIIPVIPLGLHMLMDILTNTKIELKYIYPELFFATISICVESFKSLQEELKYSGLKPLLEFILLLIFIVSSSSYGSILVINNLLLDKANIQVTLHASFLFFISSIILHIAINIFREA